MQNTSHRNLGTQSFMKHEKRYLRVTWLSLITTKKKYYLVNISISSAISQLYDIALNTTLIASLIQFLYHFNKSCRLHLLHQKKPAKCRKQYLVTEITYDTKSPQNMTLYSHNRF